MADRLVGAGRLDRPVVDAGGPIARALRETSEDRFEVAVGGEPQVRDRLDVHAIQLRKRLGTDAGNGSDRQGVEHLAQVVLGDDEQPVGLVEIGRDLRNQFVGRDSDRGRQ